MKIKNISNKKKNILDFLLIGIPFFSSLFNFLYKCTYPYSNRVNKVNKNFTVIYDFLKKRISNDKLNFVVYIIIALFSFVLLELISIFAFRFRKWILNLNLGDFKIKIINFSSFFFFLLIFINGNNLIVEIFLKNKDFNYFAKNLKNLIGWF